VYSVMSLDDHFDRGSMPWDYLDAVVGMESGECDLGLRSYLPLLQTPPDQDLCPVLAISLPYPHYGLIFHPLFGCP
jgi:hypothetical protein